MRTRTQAPQTGAARCASAAAGARPPRGGLEALRTARESAAAPAGDRRRALVLRPRGDRRDPLSSMTGRAWSPPTDHGLVTLRGGTRLWAIAELLGPYGLALSVMGDIDRQSIAGAIQTGTHGTGARFTGFAGMVRACAWPPDGTSWTPPHAGSGPVRGGAAGAGHDRGDPRGHPAVRERLPARAGETTAPLEETVRTSSTTPLARTITSSSGSPAPAAPPSAPCAASLRTPRPGPPARRAAAEEVLGNGPGS